MQLIEWHTTPRMPNCSVWSHLTYLCSNTFVMYFYLDFFEGSHKSIINNIHTTVARAVIWPSILHLSSLPLFRRREQWMAWFTLTMYHKEQAKISVVTLSLGTSRILSQAWSVLMIFRKVPSAAPYPQTMGARGKSSCHREYSRMGALQQGYTHIYLCVRLS